MQLAVHKYKSVSSLVNTDNAGLERDLSREWRQSYSHTNITLYKKDKLGKCEILCIFVCCEVLVILKLV